MATVRSGAVVLVPAALIAAAIAGPEVGAPVDPVPDAPTDAAATDVLVGLAPLPADELLPTAPGPSASGATWFCAPTTATGADDGFAEGTVLLANAGDAEARATVSVVSDAEEPTVEEVVVPAKTRLPLRLADLVTAEWAGAVIEVDQGDVAVDHLVRGPTGVALAPCAATPTDRAWFPVGATEAGAREVITVLNPFADDAVLSITFETEDGSRTPEDLEARVVPPRSIVVIELGDRVAVRREVATTVAVTSGQVVIERLQSYDGTGDRAGLALDGGAPRPAGAWWFPGVELADDRSASVVLVNPDRQDVSSVEVAVRVDGVDPADQPEPFEVEVAPGRYLVVPLDRDGRVPVGSSTVSVRAVTGPPVVAELVGTSGQRDEATGELVPDGFSLSSGSPVAAHRWVIPYGSLGGTDTATVSVVNPGGSPARIRLVGAGDGRSAPAGDPVQVPAGGRVDLDVAGGAGLHPALFEVVSDEPVVVSRRFTLTTGELTDALAIPVADRGVVPAPDAP